MFKHVAFYRFAPMSPGELGPARAKWAGFCRENGILGTLLLSREGINGALAGRVDAIDRLEAELARDPRFAGMAFRRSFCDRLPFKRLLVKIRREIIAGDVEPDPDPRGGGRLQPRELERWLDEGREMILLDTRNKQEIEHGTFRGAEDLGITRFRDFTRALKKLEKADKAVPLVLFCTGGIRCEKAQAIARREGWERAYQLEGGILRYFEECGARHYDGRCFVFDERVSVEPRPAQPGEAP